MSQTNHRPPIKERKPKMVEPNYPKCKALYEYVAGDSDELSFNPGDIIYILKEEGGKNRVKSFCCYLFCSKIIFLLNIR